MNGTTVTSDVALAHLAGIGLDEVRDRAELLARRDRKYLVTADALPHLCSRLPDRMRVLEVDGRRTFHYRSVYFDTPDLASFSAAARARPNRWKLRVRTYVDSGASWLELKVRDRRGHTVKHRRPRDPRAGDQLDAEDRRSTAAMGAGVLDSSLTACLAPTLTTAYERITIVDVELGQRTTIDLRLRSELRDGRGVLLPGLAVVETKCTGRPGDLDRLLWSIGRRPLRFSKYATSLAAARPHLPANRWHRTLGLAGFTHDSKGSTCAAPD